MTVLATTGISVTLVKNALGAATNDIGQLCQHSNVNIFSKNKPVSYPATVIDGISNWWKGADQKCGILMEVINKDLSNFDSANWRYLPPTGGSNSPYRLGDFRGYDTNKYPSVFMQTIQAKYSLYNSKTLTFRLNVNTVNTTLLSHQDIPELSGSYLGLVIKSPDGKIWILTSDTTIGAANYSGCPITIDFSLLTFNVSNLYGKNLTLYFFLSNIKGTGVQTSWDGNMVPKALFHNDTYKNKFDIILTNSFDLYTAAIKKLNGSNAFYQAFTFVTSPGYSITDCIVEIEIINRSSGSIIFGRSDSNNYIVFSQTFKGTNVKVAIQNYLYDTAGNKLNNGVTLSAGQSTVVRIKGKFMSMNQYGQVVDSTEQKQFRTQMSINIGNTIISSVSFQAKNY